MTTYNIDNIYKDLLRKILAEGKLKHNRTGVDTLSLTGYMLEYDMSYGFPLLTTKKMAWKTLKVELEGFIKGITDKQWFKDRGCNIWNEWCSPLLVPYANDAETKKKMFEANYLGPIYGSQWRNFDNANVDQLQIAINKLKNNPNCRRNIVMAWNPLKLQEMALVPCHYSFQLLCNDGILDLLWSQRSADAPIGIPFNIASYALLLEILAKECGLVAGKLIGFLADVHIYVNQLDGVNEQLTRESYNPPKLILEDFSNIDDWGWSKAKLEGYICHPSIKMPVAV